MLHFFTFFACSTFHSVVPNLRLTVDNSIKGNVRLGPRHKSRAPALNRSRLQSTFQHLERRSGRTRLRQRCKGALKISRWRRTENWPSSPGSRPRAFIRPTMYVLVATARDGLRVCDLRGGVSWKNTGHFSAIRWRDTSIAIFSQWKNCPPVFIAESARGPSVRDREICLFRNAIAPFRFFCFVIFIT